MNDFCAAEGTELAGICSILPLAVFLRREETKRVRAETPGMGGKEVFAKAAKAVSGGGGGGGVGEEVHGSEGAGGSGSPQASPNLRGVEDVRDSASAMTQQGSGVDAPASGEPGVGRCH